MKRKFQKNNQKGRCMQISCRHEYNIRKHLTVDIIVLMMFFSYSLTVSAAATDKFNWWMLSDTEDE